LNLDSPDLTNPRICLVFLFLFLFAAAIFPQRVVSLAPGITEIVFALNRGNTLVGVTKFCDYPAAAKRIQPVGGFLDVNIEAIVALNPDIVIIYPEHLDKVKFLGQKMRIVMVQHGRLADLLNSIQTIARVLGAEIEAKRLVADIQGKLRIISTRCQGKKKIRALFVAGRNVDELKNMYIIGKNDFINDLLEIAGGTNAYKGNVNYPSISMETVVFLNPEFIFEISSHYEGIADENIVGLWRPYRMIAAVKKNRIEIIKNSYWLRPGPRVALIAEELAGFFARAEN
jgi:iron complex transport system substrate-binding protein